MPLHDLSAQHKTHTPLALMFSIEDVDEISAQLGVPWERSKDVPFVELEQCPTDRVKQIPVTDGNR